MSTTTWREYTGRSASVLARRNLTYCTHIRAVVRPEVHEEELLLGARLPRSHGFRSKRRSASAKGAPTTRGAKASGIWAAAKGAWARRERSAARAKAHGRILWQSRELPVFDRGPLDSKEGYRCSSPDWVPPCPRAASRSLSAGRRSSAPPGPELNARTRSDPAGHPHPRQRHRAALARARSLDEGFDLDPDTLHRRFATHAPRLASEAARRALADARIDRRPWTRSW
jgi:hypothetical protein